MLLKVPSTKSSLEFLNLILGPCFRVKTDQEVGEVSRSLFVSILPSVEQFRLFFSIFKLSFFLWQSKTGNLQPIVENLVLLFFFAWSCCSLF